MPFSREWDDFPGKVNITDDSITFPDGTSMFSAPSGNTG
jgi:hypothetical protein